MASKSDQEDPDIAAGRAITAPLRATITSGKPPPATRAEPEDDPDVAAGRAITAPLRATIPATTTPVAGTDPYTDTGYATDMTWRGTAKEIAAGAVRAGANVINLLSDPYANLIARPALTLGATAYDFMAPLLGYDRMSPETRAALYEDFNNQPGSKIVTAIGKNIPGGNPLDPYNTSGTPGEKFVGSIAEGASTAGLLGPGGVAPVVAGGVGAGVGDVAAQNTPPWLQPAAQMVGNLAGSAATGAGTSVIRTTRGAVSDVSPANAALGQIALDKYGIPINAQDLSDNSAYRIMADQASKMPFSGAAKSAAKKQAAWQGAIAKEMGEPNATAFTADVMDRAATRIGQTFDRVARNTTIDAPSVNTMVGDLATIERDMNQVLPTNELPRLKAQLDNIIDVASKQGGTISGDSYQALTRKGAPLDLAERSTDSNVRHVAGQIRDALDDAFVRSAKPEDQAALVQAKYQYRIMRTVDQLAAGSKDGNITPAGFMQKVLATSRKFDSPTGGVAYTGGGNIGELAKIGQLMRPAPNSGTADRSLVNALTLGTLGSGGMAYLWDNPYLLATVPATLMGNRMAGAYLRSGPLANQVINNALKPPLGSPYAGVAPIMTGGDTRP